MSESNNNNRRRQSTQALLNSENELILFCDSVSVSEEGIREIIERHGFAANNIRNRIYKSFRAACKNKRVTAGIIRCLLEYFPDAANFTNVEDGWSPLHTLCHNRSATPGIIQLIIEAAPNSVRSVDNFGQMPLHKLCHNKTIDETAAVQILILLIEEYPAAVRHASNHGSLPIHYACQMRSPEFCRVLIEEYPASVRSATHDGNGNMPLHCLCKNDKADETAAVKILKFLLEKCQEAVRHADNRGRLPIHRASARRSPGFCRVLIEAYPGSEQITTTKGNLPLHFACETNSLATVDYLYKLYPDAIHHTNAQGHYPFHRAIQGMNRREYRIGLYPIYVLEIVQFLLDRDPNQKVIKFRGKSLLQCACEGTYSKKSIEAALQVVKILFDAHPETIEDERIATNIHRYHPQVHAFINEHLVLARHAKDHRLMTTPDTNGRLPLHRALQNNAMLGLIKLLVKGNPAAVLCRDIGGALPVHIACQHHDSASVVQYLLSLDATILDAVDRQWNTALHHACRGAKYETIAMLLEKYDAASVSKRNAHGKLPINMLWESDEVSERESVEYMGSVFHLVRAYPEMTMINNTT